MAAGYARTLRSVLEHQTITLMVAVATLVLSALLYVFVPKGFFPAQDTGAILGISQAPASISFTAMAERQRALGRAILADPAVESLSSFIGVDGINTTLSSGRFLINLKPLASRKGNVGDIMQRLATTLSTVPGIALYLQPVQDLTVDARVSRTQYQLSLETPDPKELARWTPRVLDALRALPEITSLNSDLQNDGLAASLTIDRTTASRLGVTPQLVDDILYDAFGQRQISIIYTQSNQYRVVLEVAPSFRQRPDNLGQVDLVEAVDRFRSIHFRGSSNRADRSRSTESGQFPAATLSFNLAPGVPLGKAVRAVDEAVRHAALPASMVAGFQGTAQAFVASLSSEPLLILAALVTVYIVLGVLYESYIHPLTIFSTLPSAGVGALLGLTLLGMELDVISLIGIVLLIGIVKKNAIMMVDFALEAQRGEGKSPRDAIYQACSAPVSSHHDDDDGRAARRASFGREPRRGRGASPSARAWPSWAVCWSASS